ncbi:MAG: nuclear transport factor 2 family protein [Acidimicrobiia bacterium]
MSNLHDRYQGTKETHMAARTDPTDAGAYARTHPNAALVRKGKEAFLRGDIETVKELLADDLVVHTSGDGPFERVYRGRDAFFGFIGQIAQLSGGTYQQEIHDVVASDDHVVALVIVRAERNGRTVEYRSAEVFHVKDGRATEAWFLNDNAYPDFWS